MTLLPDLPVAVLAGGPLSEMRSAPLSLFSEPARLFLADLSKRLLGDPVSRLHPDVASFAYWCRPANLNRLARSYETGPRRMGRGLALHIAPANVPVNFAYSLVFGLLSGNANLVRVPEREHPQAAAICAAVAALFEHPRHAMVAERNRLIRYPRNDEITAALSACCDARILWGGDETVRHLRQLPIPPRCVEVAFADRYSMCAISAEAVLAATTERLDELAAAFYNDTFLLDQNACSSPHLVFWKGNADEVERAMGRFWPVIEAVARAKYDLLPVQAVDKLVHLGRTAVLLPEVSSVTRHGNWIYRLRLGALPGTVSRHRGRHGFFLEYAAPDFGELATIVDGRYQTLTCFGLDAGELADFVVAAGLRGIDRIVPVGEALSIGLIWDGYDLPGILSRVVATS